ncbi:hypothetical protein N7470_007381 [Penicillium chermesinum]|nr:hypothetical protein N7470_007381 [Penicillium chermesinum]
MSSHGKPHPLHLDTDSAWSEGRMPLPLNDKANMPVGRPGMSPRDQVLPSIEIPRQSEKRRTESHLEHMAERMTLRSVTPSHAHGEAFGRSHGSVPNSPDDPTYKRRRTACYAGSHRDLRFDPRNGRPIPVTENLSPRLPYHRVELGPEIRLQDGHNLRQQYPSPQEQPLLLGHLREMPSGPFYAQPASLDPET